MPMTLKSGAMCLLLVALAFAGCAVGPDYRQPVIDAPPQWAEAASADGIWKPATPVDHEPRGDWWQLFGDAQLNELERRAQSGNLSLQAAVARVDQARALTRVSRSGLLPSLQIDGTGARVRTSANRPNAGSNSTATTLHNDYALAFATTYEVDFFGRVRRSVAAARASEQQTAADLENARLLLAADVAAGYFNLRALQAEIGTLEQSIATQAQILDVVRRRYQDGVANGIDLAQQELIVSTNRLQQQQLLRELAQQQHALATLLGVHVNDFELASAPLPMQLPRIPTVLPGELLQRRPDIAGAERAVAAANAQIGIARAAWFPAFTLSATDGFESSRWSTLFDASSAAWSVGLALSQKVFDAGRTRAQEKYAIAAHEQATAIYRNTVLSAWQEVEDSLAASRTLGAARTDAQSATHAADRVATITEDRYQAGLASAIERYTARQNALAAQLDEQQLIGQQWINAVFLIKATGGGWSAVDLAARD
jgi:NodT family efflux transporter outer membrane factor (OMF) lipoprotein